MLDKIPANGETWFLGQVFRAAARAGLRGVVSFADPVLRRAADGTVVIPGHRGTIYAAKGAAAVGRTDPSLVLVLPDGTSLDRRALSKVRRGECGHDYVERRLAGFGREAPAAQADAEASLGLAGGDPTAPDRQLGLRLTDTCVSGRSARRSRPPSSSLCCELPAFPQRSATPAPTKAGPFLPRSPLGPVLPPLAGRPAGGLSGAGGPGTAVLGTGRPTGRAARPAEA